MHVNNLARVLAGVFLMSVGLGAVSGKSAEAQKLESDKVVVAHRGASGYLPEHTLPAVAMAYASGAQYMEQDLMMSRDGELIVWHDLTLDRNTDVAERFPGRARENGMHYVIDFTLDELRQLRVTEGYDLNEDGEQVSNYPSRFPLWQSRFYVHTLAEQIEMVQGLNHSTGQDIGIYPEIKAPAFHLENGHDISMAVVQELKKYGYTTKDSNVFLQTFDFDELKRVHEEIFPALGVHVKLIQLIGGGASYEWMLSEEGISEIAQYADGIGPSYGLVISDESTPDNIIVTDLVSLAHQHGMAVHPYTFRSDEGRVPAYARDFEHMLELFYFEADVDGVFTDFPDTVVNFLRSRQ